MKSQKMTELAGMILVAFLFSGAKSQALVGTGQPSTPNLDERTAGSPGLQVSAQRQQAATRRIIQRVSTEFVLPHQTLAAG